MRRDYNLVVLGGGTGSFTMLQSLKKLTPHITAIVNMSDNGGSTGILRDELGVLPPGDVRQCLVALSESAEMRDMFNFRFPDSSLGGHSLGNIILSGLELQQGSFERALEVAGKVLRIRGKVVPVTLGAHQLVMQDGSKTVVGQHACRWHVIESPDAHIHLEPAGALNPKAARAILEADCIVIAPGDFYSSLLPIFATTGIAEVFQQSHAKVIFVANLVNRASHNKNWHLVDYLKKLNDHVSVENITTVLYNTEVIPEELLKRYEFDGDFPVDVSESRFTEYPKIEFMGASLFSSVVQAPNPADKLIKRNYIRHDPDKTAALVEKIYRRKKK